MQGNKVEFARKRNCKEWNLEKIESVKNRICKERKMQGNIKLNLQGKEIAKEWNQERKWNLQEIEFAKNGICKEFNLQKKSSCK